MTMHLGTIALRGEHDVVAARQRARQVAALLGFDTQDQARIATAVSEIARNAVRYAGGGDVDFRLEGPREPQALVIEVRDSGPGIADLDAILAGSYRSPTGMGLGLVGARRLMDQCRIHTSPGGTRVVMKKTRGVGGSSGPDEISRITAALADARTSSPLEEIELQNRELMRTLAELRERQDELQSLNQELEDTNRGVVALYAELEERADLLRRADETKTRFLSNMSHEFRTPLNSIRALTALLLARADGPLTSEQELQLDFIRKAADELSDVVEDLLDLAKIEAGKVEVHAADCSVEDLFRALRGMLRPLVVGDAVALTFEIDADVPRLHTDEGKLSQVLRNFISNALKFTERGVIRVRASLDGDRRNVAFSVTDTGIGIAREDHERIFQEFAQIANPLQRRVKGTGLGLPLCRRLVTLLGGSIDVESAPGVGSTFRATVPLVYEPVERAPVAAARHHGATYVRPPVGEGASMRGALLIIDDDPAARYALRKLCEFVPHEVLEAENGREGLRAATELHPAMIVLDLKLPDMRGEDVLLELKRAPQTRSIPVVVATSEDLSASRRERLAEHAVAVLAKAELDNDVFQRLLRSHAMPVDRSIER